MNHTAWRVALIRLAAAVGLAAVVFSAPLRAQPAEIITTYAGGDGRGDGGPAASAGLTLPGAVAVDAAGNVYVGDQGAIRRIAPGGTISTFVSITPADAYVTALAVDPSGGIYFIQSSADSQVRKADALGNVTVVAGNGVAGYSGDGGPATSASLRYPSGIAVVGGGDLLIADPANNRIRKVSGGIITTVAGDGTFLSPPPPSDGGPATAAKLGAPSSVVGDGAGGFYFADTTTAEIRHVDGAGIISTVTGAGFAASIAIDGSGSLYLATGFYAEVIRKVVPGVGISVIAGTGSRGFSGDGGAATSAMLNAPNGVAVDGAGTVYVADTYNYRVRKIVGGTITTLAGVGQLFLGDGGQATGAALHAPNGVFLDASGALYIADRDADRIRRVAPDGTITTVAGGGATGSPTFGDGGPATNAQLATPYGVKGDAAGNLYIADYNHHRVRKVDPSGTITTIAGNGTNDFSGDGGPATAAAVGNPLALAVDASGNVYISQLAGYRIRRVTPAGVISTVAGNGSYAYSADGVPATSTGIQPIGLAFDAAGNLVVADSSNNRIRRIDATGTISTIAGNGINQSTGDGGSALAASLGLPGDVAFDADGYMYIADKYGERIRIVDPAGNISTLAGTGARGFGGDNGPATSALLAEPFYLALDPAGNLFFSDTGNSRVRKVALAGPSPAPFQFASASGVPLSSVQQSNAIVPTGYASPTAVSVAGGEFSVGCTGTFASTQSTIAPGQSICVRHTASAIGNKDTVTTLTLGRRSGTFTSTTVTTPGTLTVAGTLDLGPQSMNTTSAPVPLTLTNGGGTTISINALSATNGVTFTHDCASLTPGASCTVNLRYTPTAQGAFAASLSVQASPGTQAVALTGYGERSLAIHYYRSILRRAPDAQGKAFWDGEAARLAGLGANLNEAWFAMATAFYFSPEYLAYNRSNADFVTDLYNTFFNRAPDASGFNYWTTQLGSGMPREVVLASFLFSPEFTTFTAAIFGNTAARAEVDMVMDLYRGLLARLPDDDGFRYWVGRFRAAQCAGATRVNEEVEFTSNQFLNSAEYAGRGRSNPQFVGDLYNALLRRGGDLAGVQYWIGQLDGIRTRDNERQQFIASAEFQARVQRVLAQGCLP